MSTRGRNRTDLFDETIGYDDEVGVQTRAGLSAEEVRQARQLYRYFNELWGVVIVVGDPGTGKDLFGNYLSYKIKRYFPHKRVLRDEKPRALFGDYGGLFNESVLAEDLLRMKEVAVGQKSNTAARNAMAKAADSWVSHDGDVLLKNSVLYLTEYWRYCYSRDPMNPMNTTMGAVHKMKRHLDCLVVGTVQLATELDKKTCLPWVDWKVTCGRSITNRTGFIYTVFRVKYDARMDVLTPLSRQPFVINFDAGAPRSYLGDGAIVVRRPDYRPFSEEERIVLTALRMGASTYEDVVDTVVAAGDMTEREVLDTLKELKFNKRKRAVDYPCFFGLYNSKSAPQVKSSLKMEE